MNQQELSQLRYINKEIMLLQKQLKEVQTGYRYDGGITTGGYNDKIHRLQALLEERLERVIETRERLERYITNIEDSLIRQMLSMRYVEGMSWKQIAIALGGGNSEENIRQMHSRFFRGKQAVNQVVTNVTYSRSNI